MQAARYESGLDNSPMCVYVCVLVCVHVRVHVRVCLCVFVLYCLYQ